MGFDPIMGVGRSPKITEDLILNPYSIGKGNIAPSCAVNSILNTSPAPTTTKNNKDIVNPDYDSSTNSAYQIAQSVNAGQSSTNIVQFDLGRNIYIDNIEFKHSLAITLGATSTTIGMKVEVSENGTNWLAIWTRTGGQTTATITEQVNYKKFRFCRYWLFFDATGAGTSSYTFDFYYLRIIPSNLQF